MNLNLAILPLLAFAASACLGGSFPSPSQEKLLKTHPGAFAGTSNWVNLTPNDENRLLDAIWRIEGANITRRPYGILKTFKTTTPRQACLNTIRHQHRNWIASGGRQQFLDYLADHYCPYSVDPVGNKNWHKNINLILK